MSKHAFLSASASSRWINCPPSASLCAATKDVVSEFALEGTAAHSLCEHKLKKALGMPTKDPTENLDFYNEEMEDCANGYAEFVFELLEKEKTRCKDPLVLIEERLDFSKWVPDGFGTGDCVIVADGVLHVIDYKHGKGVEVSSEKNSQMMCYGLGALSAFDGIYDIETVAMTIYQPRLENVSTYQMKKEELYAWADAVLSKAAALAVNGEGKFKAGEHCRFCRVKAHCRKRAEYNLFLAKYDFKMPDMLEDEEIAIILSRLDDFTNWATDVKEYALKEALKGKHYTGYKLVEGRANRKYMDEDKVAAAVANTGKDPYEKKLLGITAMTKLLGKKEFNDLLGSLICKPQGKPTLAPESDKRPEINVTTAKDDFKE